MKKKYFILFLFILLLSCSLLNEYDPDNIREWCAIDAGKVYNFEYRFGTDATESGLYEEEVYDTDTKRILSIDSTDSQIRIKFKYDNEEDTIYYIIDLINERIYHSEDFEYNEDDNDLIYVKTPVKKGTKWTYKDWSVEIKGTEETKTIKAGEFNDIVEIYMEVTDTSDYGDEYTLKQTMYWSIENSFIYSKVDRYFEDIYLDTYIDELVSIE